MKSTTKKTTKAVNASGLSVTVGSALPKLDGLGKANLHWGINTLANAAAILGETYRITDHPAFAKAARLADEAANELRHAQKLNTEVSHDDRHH